MRSYPLPAILIVLWIAMLFTGGPASAADSALLRLFAVPELVPAARLITRLGDWPILLPLTLAAAMVLYLAASRRIALLYLLLILGGRALVVFEKSLIGRARPDETGRLVEVVSQSYPSGHAAYSMIAWLGLALLVTGRRRRRWAVALSLAVAILVGLSRLVLAVHWPSDVIGGWAFGAAWTLLLVGRSRGTPAPERH